MSMPALALLLASALASVDAAHFDQDIKILASDEFEGRGPATAGETKSIGFIADQFAKAGLKAAGTRGWYQAVEARRFELRPSPSAFWKKSGKTVPLAFRDDFVASGTGAGGQVRLSSAPMVFVGYGIHAPDRDWDDFKGVSLKGKIAV